MIPPPIATLLRVGAILGFSDQTCNDAFKLMGKETLRQSSVGIILINPRQVTFPIAMIARQKFIGGGLAGL